MIFKFNRRGVRFCFALIGGVCVSVPLFRCSSVRASAADLVGVSLSVEQTLALYGNEIEVSVFQGTSTYFSTLTYSGRSTADIAALTGMSQGNVITAGTPAFRDYEAQYFVPPSTVTLTNFLIYEMELDFIPPVGSYDYQLQIPFAVNIQAAAYKNAYFWTCETGMTSRSRYGSYESTYNVYGSDLSDILGSFYALGNQNSDVRTRYGTFSTFPRPVSTPDNGIYAGLANTATLFAGASAVVGSTLDGSQNITVGKEIVSIKGLAAPNVPIYYDPSSGDITYSPTQRVYVLIGCPILYGDYILPDNGGSGSGGDDNVDIDGNIIVGGDIIVNGELNLGDLSVDVDTSDIESKLDTIIENQDSQIDIMYDESSYLQHISENSFVHTNQLISILSRLDDIYNQMVSDGIVVPSLNNAPDIAIDSAVDSRVQSELEDFSFPDVDQELDTEAAANVAGVIGSFRSWIPARMILIYSTALVLSLVVWFIFRGRG